MKFEQHNRTDKTLVFMLQMWSTLQESEDGPTEEVATAVLIAASFVCRDLNRLIKAMEQKP